MRSELINNICQPIPEFPWLGIYRDDKSFIVLFLKKSPTYWLEGVVVWRSEHAVYKIGDYSDAWSDLAFDRFNGEVRLRND